MKNQEVEWLLREKYEGVEGFAFHADCQRLAAGEPLGYVIGHVPFLDCTIWLDSHPLIPRPETEFWVEHAIKTICAASPRKDLELVRGPSSNIKILDFCAGSGAIGVAVAKAVPSAHITFAELDPAHLPTIEKNMNLNLQKPFNRMKGFVLNTTPNLLVKGEAEAQKCVVIESDLFANIPEEQTFDFILTNPPYIDIEAGTVEESVTLHEPHLALFGGVSGMEVIARIIAAARAKLAPPSPHLPTGGQLWIEHEPFQTKAITDLAHAHHFMVTTHPDQYNVPRYSILTMA